MLYLLEANTLIRANADYYPIERIPQFWDWLMECGRAGRVKIPNEIADEMPAGRDDVADWLKGADAETALRLVSGLRWRPSGMWSPMAMPRIWTRQRCRKSGKILFSSSML